MATAAAVCTPEALAAKYPCLDCASTDQLYKILAWILIGASGLTWATNKDALLEKASCFDCHYPSDKQKLEAVIKSVGYWTINDFDPTDFFADVACMDCLPPGMVKGLLVYLICYYISLVGQPD